MIVIFGSLNMDMVMSVHAMPRPGETVLCPEYRIVPGGKGANQAVAAARVGAQVQLFGKVGEDAFGQAVIEAIRGDGIDISGVCSIPDPTGCACVCVDSQGENMITVASGANRKAMAADVPVSALSQNTTLLLQMETLAEQNWLLLERAHKAGSRTILNLAPAYALSRSVLQSLSVLIMNRIEATILAVHLGFDVISPAITARRISSEYNITCVVTLGSEGALACTPQGVWTIDAMDIRPVDTTSAGDAFVGVFAAALDKGSTTPVALHRATVAGGLACLKTGAQSSLPCERDIQEALPSVLPPRRVS